MSQFVQNQWLETGLKRAALTEIKRLEKLTTNPLGGPDNG